MGPEQVAIRSCDKCIRKAVCILYHGYTQVELRYGSPSPLPPDEVRRNLGESLASKCNFYMEEDAGEDR